MPSPFPLPPLPALRAFEAAARHLSVSKAADELCVTHSAISHQLRALEAYLGYALFTKQGRGIGLTIAGKRLATATHAAFTAIADELTAITETHGKPCVNITTVPSFASRWLSPRLGRFIDAYPDIQLRLQASVQIESFAEQELDVAIRLGEGGWPNVHAERLMAESYDVVASPDFPGGLPQTTAALANYPLLRNDSDVWMSWERLADQMGFVLPASRTTLSFDDSGLLVQAAVDGLGIVLARSSLVRDELRTGRLVRVLVDTIPSHVGYWVVTRNPPPFRPAVQLFIDWLRREVAIDTAP